MINAAEPVEASSIDLFYAVFETYGLPKGQHFEFYDVPKIQYYL